MNEIWTLILLCGLVTYVTRFAGHLILARFGRIPARLDAAMNAVPAAMLATICAPVLVTGDWPERIGIVVAAILSLRLGAIPTVIISVALVAGGRAVGL